MSKLAGFVLVIVLQACVIMAEGDDETGFLERAKEAYREMKVHVVNAGSSVADYAGMYYEEHVKPVTEPYVQWAKDTASSVWDRVKNSVPGTRID